MGGLSGTCQLVPIVKAIVELAACSIAWHDAFGIRASQWEETSLLTQALYVQLTEDIVDPTWCFTIVATLTCGSILDPECWEVTTRSTKVGNLMYLGNSNGVLLVLILSCCEDESMLLA